MGDVDPQIIQRTIDTLGKIIKSPPLTEKLLSRPPFRFLHDICTQIIKQTGFMEGLFSDSQLDANNVKEKDAKTDFLDKLIDMVGLVNGAQVPVKINNILAGKEADKTNVLLVGLAEAINRNVRNSDFVKRVKNGEAKKLPKQSTTQSSASNEAGANSEKTTAKPSSALETAPTTSKSKKSSSHEEKSVESKEKSRPSRGEEDKQHRLKESEKSRKTEKNKEEEKSKEKETEKSRTKDKTKESVERSKKEDISKRSSSKKSENEKTEDRSSKRPDNSIVESEEQYAAKNEPSANIDTTDSTSKQQRPTSAKGSRQRREARRHQFGEEQTEDQLENSRTDEEMMLTMKSNEKTDSSGSTKTTNPGIAGARAPSARAAPPKNRKGSLITSEEAAVASGSGSGATTAGSRGDNSTDGARTGTGIRLIDDNEDEDDDDDQYTVVEEQMVGGGLLSMRNEDEVNMRGDGIGGDDADNAETDEHGALVTKMLQQKQNYAGSPVNGESGVAGEIGQDGQADENGSMSQNRKRERAATEKEMEKLRQSLQLLTRSANPLGKVMDFLQEDIDAMQKELEQWAEENAKLNDKLDVEKKKIDNSIEPLNLQLQEMEQSIRQNEDAICAVKSKILQNDEKIQKIFASFVQA